MRGKKGIYILVDGDILKVYHYDPKWVLGDRFGPISMIQDATPLSIDSIIQIHSHLKNIPLPIDRYFFGITGITDSENKSIRRFLKEKFKGAHHIGTKSIQLGFSQIYLDYAEKYFYSHYQPPLYYQDYILAFHYFSQSASWWRYPQTLLMIGFCHANGIGTSKDTEKAIQLWNEVLNSDIKALHKQYPAIGYLDSIKTSAREYLEKL